MPQRELVARHSFTLSGHWVVTGETFTATPRDADILVRVGRAVYAPPPVQAEAEPEPEPEKPKCAYSRRDRTAVDDGSPRPKRTYRRRDLQAED